MKESKYFILIMEQYRLIESCRLPAEMWYCTSKGCSLHTTAEWNGRKGK
jgi:hypothetical protein